jgi:nucleotide-binding universal stress UspA family protein
MFEHVLLAVDFSRHSEAALKMAAALCEGTSKRLTVLAVDDPSEVLPLEGVFGTSVRALEEGEQQLHEEFAEKLAKFCLPLDHMGLRYERIVRGGSPAETILHTASERECDLIVIGSHSRRSILEIGLGGTTAAVVKKAKSPVLVAALPDTDDV